VTNPAKYNARQHGCQANKETNYAYATDATGIHSYHKTERSAENDVTKSMAGNVWAQMSLHASRLLFCKYKI
jgi:hypothetical protein